MEKFYCLCGCEKEVKPGKKFIRGHNVRGQKHSEETKRKISFANRGENNPNFGKDLSGINGPMFGKHHSEESKAKISFANGGENCSEETRRKISIAKSGKKHSEESKVKISISNTGKIRSEEFKAKLSIINRGKIFSDETRAKITAAKTGHLVSEETKAKLSGKTCNFWQGGIQNIPYGPGNDEELKEFIRIRDNYICQECGVVWNGLEKKFHPHHIDYDKNNHIPWNRITLCRSCHAKTNSNREYWTKHLYEINFNNCVQRILEWPGGLSK